MKRVILTAIVILGLAGGNAYAQNIFPNFVDACSTDRFTLEQDTTTAKIATGDLQKAFSDGLAQQEPGKLHGTLAVQILADTTGSSCLMSYASTINNFDADSAMRRLKDEIDQLTWEGLKDETISVILVARFSESGVEFERLGMKNPGEVQVLKD